MTNYQNNHMEISELKSILDKAYHMIQGIEPNYKQLLSDYSNLSEKYDKLSESYKTLEDSYHKKCIEHDEYVKYHSEFNKVSVLANLNKQLIERDRLISALQAKLQKPPIQTAVSHPTVMIKDTSVVSKDESTSLTMGTKKEGMTGNLGSLMSITLNNTEHSTNIKHDESNKETPEETYSSELSDTKNHISISINNSHVLETNEIEENESLEEPIIVNDDEISEEPVEVEFESVKIGTEYYYVSNEEPPKIYRVMPDEDVGEELGTYIEETPNWLPGKEPAQSSKKKSKDTKESKNKKK